MEKKESKVTDSWERGAYTGVSWVRTELSRLIPIRRTGTQPAQRNAQRNG
jgi:hypothetical protein